MEIHEIELSDFVMFNSVTNEVIIDEECNEDADSLIAYWVDEVISDPLIKDAKLKAAWEAASEKLDDEESDCLDAFECLDKFLEQYENLDWIVYKITSSGIACGPVSMTVWHVVQKDTVVNEVDIIENKSCGDCDCAGENEI